MSLGTASVHSTFRGKEKATVEKLHTTQTANNMFTYMSLGAASVHSTFCGKEKATVKKNCMKLITVVNTLVLDIRYKYINETITC